MLDDLPTIIREPGTYITRDGRRVTIQEICGPATFNARGYVWKMFRGKERPRDWTIWHPSGRYRALTESPLDIVGRE